MYVVSISTYQVGMYLVIFNKAVVPEADESCYRMK